MSEESNTAALMQQQQFVTLKKLLNKSQFTKAIEQCNKSKKLYMKQFIFNTTSKI